MAAAAAVKKEVGDPHEQLLAYFETVLSLVSSYISGHFCLIPMFVELSMGYFLLQGHCKQESRRARRRCAR